LSALAFATFATAAAWIYAAVEIAFKSVTPWWWWLPVIAVYALTPAITLAYGLRHYRGLDTKSAMSAGLIIFVLEFVAVAAFTAAMLRRGVPLAVASPWGYALLYAPCAMAVLALFERAFRKVTIFLLFSALFAVPDAIVIWLYQHGVSQLGGVIGFLLPHVIALLWIAAIGYWLQRTPGAAGSSRDEVAGGGAAPASTSPYAPGTPNPALSRASA
jgi:hypothetical protein